MSARWLVAIGLVLLPLRIAKADAPEEAAPATSSEPWCASSLSTLRPDVCLAEPSSEAGKKRAAGRPRTLVIFLHGVVKPDTTWQWQQQLGAARMADRFGVTVLMPRGRRGYGPKTMEDWWTWPTSAAKQKAMESSVLSDWKSHRKTLETNTGHAFEHVYVFGFSNGAYYAANLALRGQLPYVDGYGIFAGGSAPKYLLQAAKQVRSKPAIFVGWGTADKTARNDARELATALKSIDWPHKSEERNAGHTITDAHLEHAFAFLDARAQKAASGPPVESPEK